MIATPWSSSDYKIVQVDTGWSHAVVLLQHVETGQGILYGWGRNDKGQLGLQGKNNNDDDDDDDNDDAATVVLVPTRLPLQGNVTALSCGSEFTVAVATSWTLSSRHGGGPQIWTCGWNEHGNLGTLSDGDHSTTWQALPDRLVQPPGTEAADDEYVSFPVCIAAGGSHFLAMRVQQQQQQLDAM